MIVVIMTMQHIGRIARATHRIVILIKKEIDPVFSVIFKRGLGQCPQEKKVTDLNSLAASLKISDTLIVVTLI